MSGKRILCMWLLIDISTAQDVYYAYPQNVYQAQPPNQLPAQLQPELQQPLQAELQQEAGLYLMAPQPSSQNTMYINNQMGQDNYNYQPANPTEYYQNQNYYQNQQNQYSYQSPLNPNLNNLMPDEVVVCGNNIYPNTNCMNPVPSTTPPAYSPPTECTYSSLATTSATNTTESDEEHPSTTTTLITTTTPTENPPTIQTELPSEVAAKKTKVINSSVPPSKIVPDQKAQYFLHEKKRKIKVSPRETKMFVRKLVNESSKGKVLVPYRNTMSMMNRVKDTITAVSNN